MSELHEPSFAERILRFFFRIFRILFVLFFLLLILPVVFGQRVFIIQIPFHFVCGWWIHAWKALPHLLGKWQEAVLPVGCLLMAAVIAHRFVGRWVDEKFPARTWRIRHTAAAIALLLLGSAAAIAASGVVHQMFWLANGNMTERSGKSDVTVAANNGRQLMFVLFEFKNEKGRYPNSFEELEMQKGNALYALYIRKLAWLISRDGQVPEPWILLRPGSTEVALPREPVIMSPLIVRDGVVVVLYGDNSVRSIRAENLETVLSEARVKDSDE